MMSNTRSRKLKSFNQSINSENINEPLNWTNSLRGKSSIINIKSKVEKPYIDPILLEIKKRNKEFKSELNKTEFKKCDTSKWDRYDEFEKGLKLCEIQNTDEISICNNV